MRGFETCKECKYFIPCDVPKEATLHDYPTQRKDGFCHKVFPRGYTNAGKKGGYCWHGKHRCFQFEAKPDSPIMELYELLGMMEDEENE